MRWKTRRRNTPEPHTLFFYTSLALHSKRVRSANGKKIRHPDRRYPDNEITQTLISYAIVLTGIVLKYSAAIRASAPACGGAFRRSPTFIINLFSIGCVKQPIGHKPNDTPAQANGGRGQRQACVCQPRRQRPRVLGSLSV